MTPVFSTVAEHGELRMVRRYMQLLADGLGLGRCLVMILEVHFVRRANGLVVMLLLGGDIGGGCAAFRTESAGCDGVSGHDLAAAINLIKFRWICLVVF